jgi:hypothetical protein
VCVWPDGLSGPVIGALLRHELEHARQRADLGTAIDDLYDLALRLLTHKTGGLVGCNGHHVVTMPAERDRDAAAAEYVRREHPAAVADLCRGDHRRLACSLVGAQPLDKLVARASVRLLGGGAAGRRLYAAAPALDEGRGHRGAAARCAAPWPPAVLRRVAGATDLTPDTCTAVAMFGTWRAALAAAGLRRSLPRARRRPRLPRAPRLSASLLDRATRRL